MAILINPESEGTKELARWEMFPAPSVIGSLRPGNPYIKGNTDGKPGAEYPKMLYRAERIPGSGKWATSMAIPRYFGFKSENDWERAKDEARVFTDSCQTVVGNEDEELKARGQGWRATQPEAVELRQAEDKTAGDEAAERNYRDRNMSEGAKAEAERFEAGNFLHQPEIKEQPRRRRGRPPAAAF